MVRAKAPAGTSPAKKAAAKAPRAKAPAAKATAAQPAPLRAATGSRARRSPRAAGDAAKSVVPSRPVTAAKTFTSPPVTIAFAGPEHRFARADLEIDGIDHGGASYEGRIFLNNPKADANTPKTMDRGYAGSFHIFGHGGCVGDPGHCELTGARTAPTDRRNPHPLTPAKKRVGVTTTLKSIALSAKEATVTIVPIVSAANALCDAIEVFHCTGMRFVTYNS